MTRDKTNETPRAPLTTEQIVEIGRGLAEEWRETLKLLADGATPKADAALQPHPAAPAAPE